MKGRNWGVDGRVLLHGGEKREISKIWEKGEKKGEIKRIYSHTLAFFIFPAMWAIHYINLHTCRYRCVCTYVVDIVCACQLLVIACCCLGFFFNPLKRSKIGEKAPQLLRID